MDSSRSVGPIRVRRRDGYSLGRCIGAGGMGTVFAARQERVAGASRLVAFKVMNAAVAADPEREKLFYREAAIATRLEHPNIVRTYEVGIAEGEPYFAMELVHGPTLAELIKTHAEPFPLGVTLRIVGDLARGLHAAHELCDSKGEPLGLTHSDLSPQNCMVGYDGITRLLDFGIARLEAVDPTRTESVRGKPSYLAPEQLEPGRIDRRADVFSLGLILFELLTARRLLGEGSFEARRATRASYRAPEPSELAGVSEPIATLVTTALSASVEGRFASARQMRTELSKAGQSAGLAAADDAEVADFVAQSVPPRFSPAELEREIANGLGVDMAAGASDVADLPTVAPRRRPVPSTAPVSSSRELKRGGLPRWVYALLAAALSAVVYFAIVRSGRRSAPSSPEQAVESQSPSRRETPVAEHATPAAAELRTESVARPPGPAPDARAPSESKARTTAKRDGARSPSAGSTRAHRRNGNGDVAVEPPEPAPAPQSKVVPKGPMETDL